MGATLAMKRVFSSLFRWINRGDCDCKSYIPLIWRSRPPTPFDRPGENGLAHACWWFDCSTSVMWVFTSYGWISHQSMRDQIKKETDERSE